MWQWNDGTMELYHYGVKGMKWGVRKARPQGGISGLAKAAKATRSVLSDIGRPMDGNGWTPKLKSNGHSQYDEQRRTAKKLEKYTKSFGKTAAKKAEINKNIKNYRKKYDSASAQSDHADALWKDAKAKYNALGRNRVERVLATIQNKSAAAKEYNTAFNKANSASDRADAAWAKSKEAYAKTGKNAVSRVINNIRYDTRR